MIITKKSQNFLRNSLYQQKIQNRKIVNTGIFTIHYKFLVFELRKVPIMRHQKPQNRRIKIFIIKLTSFIKINNAKTK